MPEISLPTKATQDNIYTDTQYIRGQFPVSGGTDWTVTNGRTNRTRTGFSESYSIADVSGSGYLTGLGLGYHNTGSITFQFQVDGGDYFEMNVQGGLPLLVRFNSRLRVYCGGLSTQNHVVTYVLD